MVYNDLEPTVLSLMAKNDMRIWFLFAHKSYKLHESIIFVNICVIRGRIVGTYGSCVLSVVQPKKSRNSNAVQYIWHIQSFDHRPLTIDCWLSTIDCWLSTVDHRLLSVVCWLSTVDCWQLTVDCWLKSSAKLQHSETALTVSDCLRQKWLFKIVYSSKNIKKSHLTGCVWWWIYKKYAPVL